MITIGLHYVFALIYNKNEVLKLNTFLKNIIIEKDSHNFDLMCANYFLYIH